MKFFIQTFWKPVIWLFLIAYLTLTPSESLPEMPKLFEYDKIGHAGIFAIFTLFCIKSFSLFFIKASVKKIKWMVLLISAFTGGLIEILQANFIRNRHGDITDFIADLTGIIAGLLLYNFLAKKFYKLI